MSRKNISHKVATNNIDDNIPSEISTNNIADNIPPTISSDKIAELPHLPPKSSKHITNPPPNTRETDPSPEMVRCAEEANDENRPEEL